MLKPGVDELVGVLVRRDLLLGQARAPYLKRRSVRVSTSTRKEVVRTTRFGCSGYCWPHGVRRSRRSRGEA